MSSTSEKLLADYDDAAAQIRNVKQAANALAETSLSISAAAREMELSLRLLQAKSFFKRDEKLMAAFSQISSRLERICELRNVMELGSLELETERVMQTAWDKLP